MAHIEWSCKAELNSASEIFLFGTQWLGVRVDPFRRILIADSSEGLDPISFSFKLSFIHGFKRRKRLFILRSLTYVEFITADTAALRLKIPACYQRGAGLTCYSGDFIIRLKYSSSKGGSGNWFISNRN